jgi:CMP/dCMP kinase
MSRPQTIAIDGPAASGKSTVGEALAQQLGYLYFDTGAMYRAITLLAIEKALDLTDNERLGDLAANTIIVIEPPAPDTDDHRQYTVRVDDRDITWDIRHHEVDANVSEVSSHPRVREALRQQQRRIGEQGQVVMVGRDIGTVVMPDAPLKVYLDASAEERARRRQEDDKRRGVESNFDTLLASIQERDRRDTSRREAPLRAADDAAVISTDHLSVEEVVAQILQLLDPQEWKIEDSRRTPASL